MRPRTKEEEIEILEEEIEELYYKIDEFKDEAYNLEIKLNALRNDDYEQECAGET